MQDHEVEVTGEGTEPEDYFSGSQVQAMLGADDAYAWVIDALKAEYPDIEAMMETDPEMAQEIYAEAVALFS